MASADCNLFAALYALLRKLVFLFLNLEDTRSPGNFYIYVASRES